jgi:hypothetical protein
MQSLMSPWMCRLRLVEDEPARCTTGLSAYLRLLRVAFISRCHDLHAVLIENIKDAGVKRSVKTIHRSRRSAIDIDLICNREVAKLFLQDKRFWFAQQPHSQRKAIRQADEFCFV